MKPPMQFSLITRNKRFSVQHVAPQVDPEPFGLQKQEQFEEKLQALTERISQREQTITSSRSNSTLRSGSQILNSFTSMLHHAAHGKPSSQFCHQYGISMKELERITDPQEREDFLIESVFKQIKQSLQSFMNKVELREHERVVEEWQDFQRLKRNEKTINIFGWLDVKSKYTHLRKKLQYALINTMTEDSNQARIQDYFGERKQPLSRNASMSTNVSRKRQLSVAGPLKVAPKVQVTDLKNLNIRNWDDQLESNYKQKSRRSSAVGLYPVIQQTVLNNVGQSLWSQQREALLTKYTEGGCLTAEEVKFIANTSTLMNQCADKAFLQRTIQYLDQDILEEIENQIAENILTTYGQLQKEAKLIRKEWLIEQNRLNREEGKALHEKLMKRIETKLNQQKMERIKRKMMAIFRDVVKKTQYEEELQEERDEFIRSQKGKNKIIYKFKEKMMNVAKRVRKQHKAALHKQFITRNLPKKTKLLFKINKEMKDTEYIKRLFHPPSKLLLSEEKNLNHSALDEQNKYKLPIRSYNNRKNEFARYISGGPQSERIYASKSLIKEGQKLDASKPQPHRWITREVEEAAINKIKASIRAYIQRKKYQKIKDLPQSKEIIAQHIQKEKEERIKEKHTQMQVVKQIQSLMNLRRSSSSSPALRRMTQVRKFEEMKLKTRKLFQAAQKRCLSIALQSGFLFTEDDANFRDEFGRTALSYAAEVGDEQICKYLLSLKANVNVKSKAGNTPMHYAFKSNNEAIIVRFLNEGGDLNVLNVDGMTPLAMGSEKVLRRLNLIHLVSSAREPSSFDNNASLRMKYPKLIEPEGRVDFESTISRFG